MINLYDIKRKTESFADGVNSLTWTVIDTRTMDIQPTRFSAERNATVVQIQVGGEVYIPSHRGWFEYEADVTAADRITSNSGTTDLLVLRVYPYESHKEMDLRLVED